MTDTSLAETAAPVSPRRVTIGATAPRGSFRVIDTYWGYIVEKSDGPRTVVALLQLAAMLVGCSLLAVALGLMLLPEALAGGVDMTLRAGASVICGGAAAYLLWFASRGTQSEVQIDTLQGEVREVVRNRAGRPSLVGRYGVDSIGGVFLDRTAGRGDVATLVLRYRNTAQILPVATGLPQTLEPLRDRIGRDLMIQRAPVRPAPARRAA